MFRFGSTFHVVNYNLVLAITLHWFRPLSLSGSGSIFGSVLNYITFRFIIRVLALADTTHTHTHHTHTHTHPHWFISTHTHTHDITFCSGSGSGSALVLVRVRVLSGSGSHLGWFRFWFWFWFRLWTWFRWFRFWLWLWFWLWFNGSGSGSILTYVSFSVSSTFCSESVVVIVPSLYYLQFKLMAQIVPWRHKTIVVVVILVIISNLVYEPPFPGSGSGFRQ